MNIEKCKTDMYNKIENFILENIHNKNYYNYDLLIDNELIKFSINNENFTISCDYSCEYIFKQIKQFIDYYNF